MKRGDIILFVFSGILMLSSFSALGREPLTFEQRIKAQEAIEKVYYNHRIWPKENKTPKPAFEKMVSKETIEAKVTDYLKKSAALEKFWYRPITGEQLQAEMDRMAKGTKDPQTLNELFSALNNDPYLIAECLARPVLADRLVRNWYANDERFHKETREKAEEALKHLTPENFCENKEGQYSKITYKLDNEGREEMDRPDLEDGAIGLSEKEFSKMFQEIPEEGKISAIHEKNDCFVILHTVGKNEGEIIVERMTFNKTTSEEWLKGQEEMKTLQKTEETVTMALPPVMESGCTEGWDNGILDDVVDPRSGHSAVWTGSEMIIWGGSTGYAYKTGGRYNPSTDTWNSTSTGMNCPSIDGPSIPNGRYGHTAIWTGNKMIIWGGGNSAVKVNTGGIYDPLTDAWTATSTTSNCPSPRIYHTAVWTGSEMIVWGGLGSSNLLQDGGRYNPVSDTWLATSIGTNCPDWRHKHTAIWTGSEMIIWGGAIGGATLNTGGRYNPLSDEWSATSTDTNCPSARDGHTAVWTGSKMIVWGGFGNTGGQYEPISDTWVPTSQGDNCPSNRNHHTAIWTGTEMIVWGGKQTDGYYYNTGGKYNPVTDSWISTSIETNLPAERVDHTAVWTGTEMIIWGGWNGVSIVGDTGGRYNPLTDTWIPTSKFDDFPTAREGHSAVWTGAEMIVWGGLGWFNTGGNYILGADSWMPTSTGNFCPSTRSQHTAVWTGTEMIIWGGNSIGTSTNTGGRYNPISDSWLQTSTALNVPSPRYDHTAVWDGTRMIVWGGREESNWVNTGGIYNPLEDTWTPTSTETNCPTSRVSPSATWTGLEMIVWGGIDNNGFCANGGIYNPTTNSWRTMSSGSGCPSGRYQHTSIWTGSEMIVWGGDGGSYLNTGGKYAIATDTWESTSIGDGCPVERKRHTAVWGNNKMIVWGGSGIIQSHLRTGGCYTPSSDTWTTTLTDPQCPSERSSHTSVWTGTSMIVWGGGTPQTRTGGIYYTGLIYVSTISGPTSNTCPSSSVSLSIPSSYVSYQWSLDGSPISGAISSEYEATVSGSYTVSVTDSNGCSGTSDPHVVTITPCIPNILYSSHGAFTQVTGDGDAYFEKGELWSVPVTVTNSGNTPASNVTAILSGNGITMCNATGSFGTIAAGGTGTFTYSFVIDDDFSPCGGNINFNLGSKACSELTPAGTDETNLFSVQVGQMVSALEDAAEAVLQPSSADSYVSQYAPTTNYGTATIMKVQGTTFRAMRFLVQFDFSAIPAGATINSATLELYATSAPTVSQTLDGHMITAGWTETAATWNAQPSFTASPDASISGGTGAGWRTWNVTSVVRDWLDGTYDNNGMMVKCNNETVGATYTYSFATKEYTSNAAYRPILRVNYTPVETWNCDYVGSGECDAVLTECAPGDTYENGQTWSGTSQSWPALTGATGYKLYRGIQSGLPNLLTADPDSCLRYEGSSTSIDLSADDPSSEIGRLYWYIVSGTNGSGEGPAGNGRMVNSSGVCE